MHGEYQTDEAKQNYRRNKEEEIDAFLCDKTTKPRSLQDFYGIEINNPDYYESLLSNSVINFE